MKKKYIYSCLFFVLIVNVYGALYNAGRTFEGRRIHITEVPFVVLIMPEDQGYCTGFIIASEWIMTAAHCFGNEGFNGSVEISIGIHDQLDQSMKIIASSVTIHPDFYHKGSGFDIALIHLEDEIKISKKTNIIPLGDKNWPFQELKRRCYTIGYGYHFNMERIGVLHGGQVTAVYGMYTAECEVANRLTTSKQFIWTNNNESVHICYGDSGGPLVCDRQAVGMAVISFNCGEKGPNIHCGGKYVDAFLYLYNHLQWLQSYVSCLPSSCGGSIEVIQVSAIGNLDVSLYAMLINILVVIL